MILTVKQPYETIEINILNVNVQENMNKNGYLKLDPLDLKNCDEIFTPHITKNPYGINCNNLFTKNNIVYEWHNWNEKTQTIRQIGVIE